MDTNTAIMDTLSSLMKHIRKEIKTGKVDSHVAFEQKDDTFSIITKLKGKQPTKQTWEIPQEDRDDHLTLLSSLSKLQKEDPFFKLMESIRGSRRIYHSDEIWKKNVIHFMGEAYDLDQFVDLRQKAEPLLEDIRIQKEIQNKMTETVEKNVILQSLYQALVLKEYMDTKDIEQYRVLHSLLEPKRMIHQVKTSDDSVRFVADGEPIEGMVEQSYPSLKQYEVNTMEQKDETVVGLIVNWSRYKETLKELGMDVQVLSSQILDAVTHFVIANESSRLALGMGSYEGYTEGQKPLGGNSVRRALSYGQGTLPAVKDGKLYRSRLAATMSSSIDGLAIGEEKEDMLEIELWEVYSVTVADRSRVRELLKQEREVLKQNWSIQESQWKSLFAAWDTEGIRPAALHRYGKKLFCPDGRLLQLMMKQLQTKPATHITTTQDEVNHTLLLRWILANTNWSTKIQDISTGVEKDAKQLKILIQTLYGIRLNRASLEGLDEFVEAWIDSEPVAWDSPSLEQSILDSGFESPRISADELVTFVRDYGDAIWKKIRGDVDIQERYGMGAVLGVFLSILHPSLRNHRESEIRIVSGRDHSMVLGTLLVTKDMRDEVRRGMSSFGIEFFELPMDEVGSGGGASERKEGAEIDDLEIDREEGKRTMTIGIDRGMSMRLI